VSDVDAERSAGAQRRDGALLWADHVGVVYNRHAVALHGVSIALREGEIVALLGPNGAGKTTTMRSIGGFLPADNARVHHGAVYFDGNDITGLRPHEVAARGITLVRERDKVFATLAVEENLRVVIASGTERQQRAAEAVRSLFPVLEQRRKQVAGYLSGGERQMLGLAMALLAGPRVLIADEVSLGIAPAVVGQLMEVIVAIRDLGMSVLLVEQNATAALGVADYAYILETGAVVFEGTPSEIEEHDQVRQSYLGLGTDDDSVRGYRDLKRSRRVRRW